MWTLLYECLMFGLSAGAAVGGFFLGCALVIGVGCMLGLFVIGFLMDHLP